MEYATIHMTESKIPFLTSILNYASRLRHPQLFALVLVLLLLDTLVPDFIPFLDELILGIIAIILGTRRKKLEDRPTIEGEKDD